MAILCGGPKPITISHYHQVLEELPRRPKTEKKHILHRRMEDIIDYELMVAHKFTQTNGNKDIQK